MASDNGGRVAFCGLGIMGGPMADNLAKAGFELSVYTRTREKAEAFAAEHGARVAATPREAAEGASTVITMVPDAPEVEDVLRDVRDRLEAADDRVVAVLRCGLRRAVKDRQSGRARHLVVAADRRNDRGVLTEVRRRDERLPALNRRQARIDSLGGRLAARVIRFPGPIVVRKRAFEARHDLVDVAVVARTELA